MDRKDAVETMVQNGFIIIDEKYTELKGRLPSSKQQNYEVFQTLFEAQDKELMKRLHKDIDMLLLNGGNCWAPGGASDKSCIYNKQINKVKKTYHT